MTTVSDLSSAAADAAVRTFVNGLRSDDLDAVWKRLPSSKKRAALLALGDEAWCELPPRLLERLHESGERALDDKAARTKATAAAEGARLCAFGPPALQALAGRVHVYLRQEGPVSRATTPDADTSEGTDDEPLYSVQRLVVKCDGETVVFYERIHARSARDWSKHKCGRGPCSCYRGALPLTAWTAEGVAVSRSEWRRATRAYIAATRDNSRLRVPLNPSASASDSESLTSGNLALSVISSSSSAPDDGGDMHALFANRRRESEKECRRAVNIMLDDMRRRLPRKRRRSPSSDARSTKRLCAE